MPIISIISQPAANSLNTAYNALVLRVSATKTGGTAVPPVVYCDIYIAGVFYKTLSKTIYDKLNVSNSEFEFDIADALQEKLRFQDPVNGATAIITASNVYASVQCKFRSSGYNSDGFLTPEGTVPVQGTGTTAPTSGTGTASNTFIVINSGLQHEDNQDLASHLNTFKPAGTWANDAFPLTHRPAMYISLDQSDYYPIIYNNPKLLRCFVLHYRIKGTSSYATANICQPCLIELLDLAITVNGDGNFVLTWTNVNGVPYSVEIEWSTNGVDWNPTSPTYNSGLTSAVVDEGLSSAVNYYWRAVPYCDPLTPGQGMLAQYFASSPPGTNDVVLKNLCTGAFNVTRFFQDGVNLLSPALIPGTQATLTTIDTTALHNFGCRIYPVADMLFVMKLVRSGSTIYTFSFSGSADANNSLQWQILPGDTIEIKEDL